MFSIFKLEQVFANSVANIISPKNKSQKTMQKKKQYVLHMTISHTITKGNITCAAIKHQK
jgi:hypothetical protein